MAVITSGKTFANGEQLSAAKLNEVIRGATFNSSDAVDGSTMTIIGGAMAVNTIAAAQIGTDAVETVKIKDANVTLPKIATQADQTVLANVSGGTASPTAVPIVDNAGILINNDSLGTSDTKGATQGNIKAYVDGGGGFNPASYNGGETTTLPNGLIMKFGSTSNKTVSYDTDFPTASISVTVTHQDPFVDNLGNASFVTSSNAGGFVISCGSSNTVTGDWFWQAIGH